MQTIWFLFRFFIIQSIFITLTYSFSFFIANESFAIAFVLFALFLQVGFLNYSEKLLFYFLKPQKILFVDTHLHIIETPVSEVFVSASLFSSKKTIWITRGLLMSLSNVAAFQLIQSIHKTRPSFQLSWDTGLATLGLCFERLLPKQPTTLLSWFFYFYIYSFILFISFFLSKKATRLLWINFLNKNKILSKSDSTSLTFIATSTPLV